MIKTILSFTFMNIIIVIEKLMRKTFSLLLPTLNALIVSDSKVHHEG